MCLHMLISTLGNKVQWSYAVKEHAIQPPGELGPLYTMTKGCDNENVRALETHLKAVP